MIDKKIQANEKEIIGKWILVDSKIKSSDTVKRIEWLTKNHLIFVRNENDGWDTVYRDPDDSRLWLLTYPQSHLHGGGPPSLILGETSPYEEE